MKRVFSAGFTVAFLALTFSPSLCQEQSGATPEVWGGRGISMVVSGENVTIEFDCAQGVITTPIHPDANGNFSAAGTFTQQRGGPVMKDNPPRDVAATYRGTIHGETMHLQVVLQGNAQPAPEFTLTKGAPGRIVKCR